MFPAAQGSENHGSRLGTEAQGSRNPADGPRRAPLGVITNKQQQRKAGPPPLRHLKARGENGQDENARVKMGQTKTFSVPACTVQSQGFMVHKDEEQTSLASADPSSGFNSSEFKDRGVGDSTLPREPFRCLLDISVDREDSDSAEDSPMVLEASSDVWLDGDGKDVLNGMSSYAPCIFEYLKELEVKYQPRVNYMKKQPDISYNMRSILVDWLVEVAEEYNLHRETLFLAVNYIDRFLSLMAVYRGKLQLVGAASMFVASKYEEIYPPDMREFVYITDDTYTKNQVLKMEHLILKVLQFNISAPTANWFLTYYLYFQPSDETLADLCMYLLELTLMDGEHFLKFFPSLIAASSLFMARYMLEYDPWPQEVEVMACYNVKDLKECMHEIHTMASNARNLAQQAIYQKYSSRKFNEVSLMKVPTALNYKERQ